MWEARFSDKQHSLVPQANRPIDLWFPNSGFPLFWVVAPKVITFYFWVPKKGHLSFQKPVVFTGFLEVFEKDPDPWKEKWGR